MLREKSGRVLKSGEKPILQEREIAFYEKLEKSDDPIYREISAFTSQYYGTMESTYNNKRTRIDWWLQNTGLFGLCCESQNWKTFYLSTAMKFLILKDITEGMAEPCVMDVKIGRRTWDPLAGPEKREADNRKYAASKKAYGFCIPGFQVYSLETGQLERFNKDYGKKLDAEGVVDGALTLQSYNSSECIILPVCVYIYIYLSHDIFYDFRSTENFPECDAWRASL